MRHASKPCEAQSNANDTMQLDVPVDNKVEIDRFRLHVSTKH